MPLKNLRPLAFVLGLLPALFLVPSYAQAQNCSARGDLDARFCDANGDLLADTPTDKSKIKNPDTLVFSYTPVEDPAVYENAFSELMAHMSKITGKKIRWFPAESYAAPEPQPEAKDQMDALYTLLLTQAADGSFPFAAIRGFVNDTRAFDILMDMHGEQQLCTAVALAVLARDYGDRQAEWKPAADKARRFLGSFSLDVKGLI